MAQGALSVTDERMLRRHSSYATDILAISENQLLSVYLSGLFRPSGWAIAHATTCRAGVSFLKGNQVAVAVCEENLPDGSWRDVADVLSSLPHAPALVVVGRGRELLHDVLASGGFDALVRPLRESDVVWTIASAWHTWTQRPQGGGSGALRCSGG